SATPPAGWSTSVNAPWVLVDDPGHSYGTGRFVEKAGTIFDNQVTSLRSPVFSGNGNLFFRYWVSSEAGFDGLQLWISFNGGPFQQQNFFDSGVPDTVTNPSWPANLASSIAVGASTDWDYRADYSEYGGNIDFVASSSGGNAGITTTDRTGADGYDPGDYTSSFGGTSSATPLAAGVAALMLSR